MKTSVKRENKYVVNSSKNNYINLHLHQCLFYALSLFPFLPRISLIYLQVIGTIFFKISVSAIYHSCSSWIIIIMIWVCIIINFFKLFEERMGFRYFGVFNAESLQLIKVTNKQRKFINQYIFPLIFCFFKASSFSSLKLPRWSYL